MSKIDEIIIDKIREAAGIVDVVGDFVELKKSGKEYDGLCPFHDDKNLGSFKVSPSKNICTCFACNESYDPVGFLMKKERLSFPDAIRWLGQKYGIVVDEEAKRFKPKPSTPKKELPIPQDLPPRFWPLQMVTAKMNTDSDLFVSWLYSLPWSQEQKERIPKILKNLLVGHSTVITKRDGVEKRHDFTLFWEIDDKWRVHNGHLMKYRADGHRIKDKDKDQYATTWIHARMQYADPTKLKPFNNMENSASYCLFGLHQLTIPGVLPDTTINIVESEKTAIICSIFFGKYDKHIWMACGGLGNLTNKNDMLRSLINQGRHIVLYPDKDGIKQWQAAAQKIGYKHLTVNTEFIDKYWIEIDGPKADIADIVVRMLYRPQTYMREQTKTRQQRIEELKDNNENVKTLIEKLQLE